LQSILPRDVVDAVVVAVAVVADVIVMGRIVLGRQVNVYFSTDGGVNAMFFVGMDFRFGTVKIHDCMAAGINTSLSIVVYRAIL
jgi:hypothetical protein